MWRKPNVTNLEDYKKSFKQTYYTNQYDLDKIIEEMFYIRQELFVMRCRTRKN